MTRIGVKTVVMSNAEVEVYELDQGGPDGGTS